MKNIRSFLNWDGGYHKINREERNLAAILYHLLLIENNFERFLELIECEFPIVQSEKSIYFEYSYLRDLWHNARGGNRVKRDLILNFLQPENLTELKQMSTLQFNTYFGVVPTPSAHYIQSPGKWSIERYRHNILDKEEFFKVCKFKWAFNVKPDIVIHTSHNTAICIECKFDSTEGVYPTKPSEVKEFKQKGLLSVTQTSLQKYLMEELLGINTQFIFLVQKKGSKSETHTTLLWKEAFSSLKMNNSPQFIREWVARL